MKGLTALTTLEDKEAEPRKDRQRKASERANKTHKERQEECKKDKERKMLSKTVVEIKR